MTADPPAALPLASLPPAAVQRGQRQARPTVSLRRNSAWMLAGNMVFYGCQFGMVVVLARVGTPAMVGQFVLALAVTAPVMAFFMLQLRTVQATDARRDYRFGDYLALRLATTAVALAIIVSVALAFGFRRETALVIIAAAILAAVDSMSDVVYGLLQQHERLDRMAQSMILRGLLALATLTAVVLLTRRLFYGILAVAVVRGLVFLTWDLHNTTAALHEDKVSETLCPIGTSRAGDSSSASQRRFRTRSTRLLSLAWLSLPLGLVMMLLVLSNYIPRYFVANFSGEAALGIFGAIGYLSIAGTMAVGALGESAVPRLARCYAQGQTAAFALLLLKLAAIGGAIGAAGIAIALVAGPQILMLYGPAYAAHGNLLVWMMVASAIGYITSFSGYGITSARYFFVQIPLFALGAATTAAACWWLVPRIGLQGAALSLAISALVQLVGAGLVLSHAMRSQSRRSPDEAMSIRLNFPEQG
ncbi:MAG: lipopolysaccharide biosynthesis protein [Thermoguttaceae bacterium]